jgi:hypothetical protein
MKLELVSVSRIGFAYVVYAVSRDALKELRYLFATNRALIPAAGVNVADVQN